MMMLLLLPVPFFSLSTYRNQLQFLWMPFLLALMSHRKQQHTNANFKTFSHSLLSFCEKNAVEQIFFFAILNLLLYSSALLHTSLLRWLHWIPLFVLGEFLMKNFIFMLLSLRKKVNFSSLRGNFFYVGALERILQDC